MTVEFTAPTPAASATPAAGRTAGPADVGAARPRSGSVLPGPRATAVLLVVAPLAEIVEALLSPLDGRSSTRDLAGIAAHPGRFELSLLCGLLGTVLFLPAFLGLAEACVTRSRRLARTGAWLAVASMAGFCAVRGIQVTELAAVRTGLPRSGAARMTDHVVSNPVGAVVLLLFIGGALLGTVVLAAASWRAGFPKPAAVLLGVFQVVDLAMPEHPETLTAVSHLVLLAGLAWLAAHLWRSASRRPAEVADAPPVD